MSALIGPRDAERAIQWIAEAEKLGARLRPETEGTGISFTQPSCFMYASSASVSCQEVFAPIVMINKVSSIEEAIRLVNDSKYGLQAGIYTENIRTAFAAAEALEVGAS